MDLLINKKALHDYEIREKKEAGIVLLGTEVKSLRQKNASLKESYLSFDGGELFLKNAHIPPYQAKHQLYQNFDTYRKRKILIHKKELNKLKTKMKEKGNTIIPLRIYTKGKYLKIEIALARGKKEYDKREDLKKKSIQKDLARIMKRESSF